jgi:hypothetical protein
MLEQTETVELKGIKALANRFHSRRVVLISNDPRNEIRGLSKLNLGLDDLVVQFNLAKFYTECQSLPTKKIFVFNKNHHASYWGFSEKGQPNRPYLANPEEELGLIFIWSLSELIKPFVSGVMPPSWYFAYNHASEKIAIAYEPGKAPSVGLMTLALFRTLRDKKLVDPFEIYTLGFTGIYPENSRTFEGHDHPSEGRTVASWKDIIRLDFTGEVIGE